MDFGSTTTPQTALAPLPDARTSASPSRTPVSLPPLFAVTTAELLLSHFRLLRRTFDTEGFTVTVWLTYSMPTCTGIRMEAFAASAPVGSSSAISRIRQKMRFFMEYSSF